MPCAGRERPMWFFNRDRAMDGYVVGKETDAAEAEREKRLVLVLIASYCTDDSGHSPSKTVATNSGRLK